MKVIARIRSDFPEKFGIPRQSGLVDDLRAMVVLEPEYRNPAVFCGLEGYSYIWLLWQFSEAVRDSWSPTVHPPRLGGNRRKGVFATRSPFRPNPIGLSSVRLLEIGSDSVLGPVLVVSGADLMDRTPIYDIKPYLPYTDSHPDAAAGFAGEYVDYGLEVNFPAKLLTQIAPDKRDALLGILSQDPRPAYQDDPERVYGVAFAGQNIRFRVKEGVVVVCSVEKYERKEKTKG